MTKEGDFFVSLIPPKEGIAFSIRPNQIYEVIKEDGLEISFHAKSLKKLTSFSVELLPKFLFFIDIDDRKIRPTGGSLLKYPPLPNYERKENKIILSPKEYSFERDSSIIIKTRDDVVETRVHRMKTSKINIDDQIYSKFLHGESGSILIMQSEFSYVLEEIRQIKYQVEKPGSIFQVRQSFYLSLKDVLDPENGLERLTQDVKENKYVGENSQKLKKLLDILRVARGEEEHEIATSLFLHDHDLFLFIYKELFQDSLIPYMSRKELSKVISQIDDHDLCEILDYPSKKKKLYSNLISKNRMSYLEKMSRKKILVSSRKTSASKREVKKIESASIWSWIEDVYRQEKQRLVLLPGEQHEIRRIIKEIRSDNFKKGFRLHGYISKSSDITYLGFKKNKIYFLIKDSFKKLDFYFEIYKGRFILKQFRHIFKSILTVQCIPKLPFRIIIGGLDHENKLYENIVLFS